MSKVDALNVVSSAAPGSVTVRTPQLDDMRRFEASLAQAKHDRGGAESDCGRIGGDAGGHARARGHEGDDSDDGDGHGATVPLSALHPRIDLSASAAATAQAPVAPQLDPLLGWIADRLGAPTGVGQDGLRWTVHFAQGTLPEGSLELLRGQDGFWLVARQCSASTLRAIRSESAALKARFREAGLDEIHIVAPDADDAAAYEQVR